MNSLPTPSTALPQPPTQYDALWLSRTLETLKAISEKKLSKETANSSILLQSSGGKIYEIKVDDLGVLSTTYISG